ncbi:MAG TPA: superoxide dismutase [Thermoanaerobaculia bacterium]|nr:superoxide dismutase [Thermoanaerobaculia bacterium]
MPLTRRQMLTTLGLGTLAVAAAPRLASGQTPAPPAPAAKEPFTLPPLPYPAAALEPHLDELTMTIHHDRHHQAYVNGLNAAIEKAPELAGRALETLLAGLDQVPEAVRTAVRNHGGGHFNHSLFWTELAPGAGGAPTGAVADAIRGAFGSFDTFRERFRAAALGVFGSGWAWLSVGKDGLLVHATPNQDTPLAEGRRPLLGLDVWEHAYYLKFQNRRADYIDAFWNVVSWAEVNRRLAG